MSCTYESNWTGNALPLVCTDCSTSKVECVQKVFDLIFDIIYMYVLVCLGKKNSVSKEVKTTKHAYKYV